jgi:POT family proton-dependent oligopeptide transporter
MGRLNGDITTSPSTDFFKSNVLGQRSGLFVLFFTEMWERFSFYGMRVLLMQFLTAAVIQGSPFSGWSWTAQQAGALYGTYAMMLYLTPIIGGIIADKYIGSRKAVIIGSAIMTLGHAAMAFDTSIMFFLGLVCLVIGTGFFKPNMPSILGEMYKDLPEKKDGAYTIFYMGVNAGAFFGMMLCGYIAETYGWHWGFGLAGIFMLLGTLQFVFAKPLMGNLGVLNKSTSGEHKVIAEDTDTRNPFTIRDYVLIAIVSIIGFVYAFNDPLSKNGIVDVFSRLDTPFLRGQYIMVIVALILFIYLIVTRIMRYDKVVRDRMFAVVLLAFFLGLLFYEL